MITARWTDADGGGLEHLTLSRTPGGHAADGVVLTAAGTALRYRIGLDGKWRVRTAEIEAIGGGSLVLTGDGEGRWSAPGGPLPHIDGAIDIDLTASPFTNTLPIRRLDLAVGASAWIEVAYIDCERLEVTRARQRYTRLAPALWRFETASGDFVRELPVDEHGLVLDYPGLFRRVS